MTETIWVALFGAHTGVGRVARLFGGYPYTHIALAFSAELDEFVTFARRRARCAMDAGFMRETRACQAARGAPAFEAKVFAVPMSAAERAAVMAAIALIESDEAYVFNVFSAVGSVIGRPARIAKAHTCLTFTGDMLALVAAARMPAEWDHFGVKDYDHLLAPYVTCEGTMPVTGLVPVGYFDAVPRWRNLVLGWRLVKTLLRRVRRGTA